MWLRLPDPWQSSARTVRERAQMGRSRHDSTLPDGVPRRSLAPAGGVGTPRGAHRRRLVPVRTPLPHFGVTRPCLASPRGRVPYRQCDEVGSLGTSPCRARAPRHSASSRLRPEAKLDSQEVNLRPRGHFARHALSVQVGAQPRRCLTRNDSALGSLPRGDRGGLQREHSPANLLSVA